MSGTGWFELAADQGDPLALSALAHMYEQGRGVPADARKAEKLRREALAAGASSEDSLGLIVPAAHAD